MNETRTFYIKVLPLVFLGGLLAAGLQLFSDLYFKPGLGKSDILPLLTLGIKQLFLWLAIGLAFQKMKQAALGFGVVLLVYAINFLLNKAGFMHDSIVLRHCQHFLLNVTFLPVLVFGIACFNIRSIPCFLPLALYAYAISILFHGSAFLNESPYNNWYRFFRIEQYFKVYVSGHSYMMLNILSYTFHIAALCSTYIIIGECVNAAANGKSVRRLFHIDFQNRYTNTGTLCMFYALRLIINLLVVGLFTYPVSYFTETGRLYYNGVSVYTFVVNMVAGLLCLAVTVLYYRKFLIEYFIGIRKKIYWLFWIVNLPIIGLLVFPFVVLLTRTTSTTEERVRFFYNDTWHQKPYKILVGLVVFSLLGVLFGPGMYSGSADYWILWFVELGLLIWYASAISGYYMMLITAGTGLVFFLISIYGGVQRHQTPQPAFFGGGSAFTDKISVTLWLVSAFNTVQYAILLPIFHLHTIKTIQEPYVSETLEN
jgi:hypothetical protein